jgi:peroxiredoxin
MACPSASKGSRNMKTIIPPLIISVISLATSLGSLGADNDELKPDFQNDTGWVWQMSPSPAGWTQRAADGGMVMRLDELKGDRLLLTFAYPVASGHNVIKFRPVAVSKSGQRFEFRRDGTTGTKEVFQEGHVLDLRGIPRDQINFLGIEKLTKDNLQNVIAPNAFQKLKEAGAAALPYPVVGKPYEFELASIDGRRIASKDLRGKVVLLDFWARWCGVCMAKMPKLKETFARLHGRGFEVIGINHDYSLEVAKATIAKQELPWPNVLAPVEKSQRELWEQATGAFSIPRLLLLDREGILRANTSPSDLEAELEKLIGK